MRPYATVALLSVIPSALISGYVLVVVSGELLTILFSNRPGSLLEIFSFERDALLVTSILGGLVGAWGAKREIKGSTEESRQRDYRLLMKVGHYTALASAIQIVMNLILEVFFNVLRAFVAH